MTQLRFKKWLSQGLRPEGKAGASLSTILCFLSCSISFKRLSIKVFFEDKHVLWVHCLCQRPELEVVANLLSAFYIFSVAGPEGTRKTTEKVKELSEPQAGLSSQLPEGGRIMCFSECPRITANFPRTAIYCLFGLTILGTSIVLGLQ